MPTAHCPLPTAHKLLTIFSPSDLGKMFDLARAVADLFGTRAHAIEQRQVKVRHGLVRLVDDVASGFQSAVATTGQQNGQILVIMAVAVTDAATVNDHRMVEQRP